MEAPLEREAEEDIRDQQELDRTGKMGSQAYQVLKELMDRLEKVELLV